MAGAFEMTDRSESESPRAATGDDSSPPRLSPQLGEAPLNSPRLTKSQYCYRILEHARILCDRTLFPGHGFEGLAGFLSRAKPASPPFPQSWGSPPNIGREDFAIAYEWDDSSRNPEMKRLTRPMPPLPTNHASPSGTIVFLTGHQTADWILEIGSYYDVDPEFFRRHLDYLQPSYRSGTTQAPQMPSFRKDILKFLVTSVGKHEKISSKSLSMERSQASDDMKFYLRSLRERDGERWAPGTPLVRTFALHDLEEFSIQQAVTVTLCRSSSRNNWICIVWLDAGYNLLSGQRGPWIAEDEGQSIAFDPVSLHKPYVSLKKHWNESDMWPQSLPQSLSTLPCAYGKTLNPTAAQNDPFYALNELFTFATASELHFLDAVEDKVARNAKDSLHKAKDPMKNHADLSYLSRIVGEHAENISSLLSFVESRIYSKWPRDTGNHSESAAIWLQTDLQYVLKKAMALQLTCVREMDTIMTRSALEEAKMTVAQNRRVLKLTILASLFAPLAFTTSIFGMNFVQPTAQEGSWFVFIIAIPLATLAITIVIWDQAFVESILSTAFRKLDRNRNGKMVSDF